jgi:undecaprenyl-diphosphatase
MAIERRQPLPRPALAILAAAAAAFALLAGWASVQEATLRGFDRPVTETLVDLRAPGLTEAMRAISILGSRAVLGGMLIALTVWALVTRECQRAVAVVIGAFLVALLLEWGVKALVGRARPEPALQLSVTRSPAFPSGHALAAAAFYGLLPVVLGTRWLGHALAWGAVLLIGFSRVYLGVHWLTDVVGGILLGVAVVALGVLVLRGHRLDPARCPGGHPR